MIRSCDADSAINDEENQRRARDCDLCLFEDALRDLGLFAGKDAAGIYNFIGTSVPADNSVDSIARDAGLGSHDGSALANEAIEQRGFSDIRASDDSDQGQRGRHEVLRW